MILRKVLATVVNSAPAEKIITRLEKERSHSTNTLRVLTYHRVADPEKIPDRSPTATVTPEAFEQQIRFLQANYCVVSAQQVLEASQNGNPLPHRSLLITFDDAYQDFLQNALPILRRYQLPATLFVPTAFPDHPERVFWWDQLYYAIEYAQSLAVVQTPVGQLPVETKAQRKQAFRLLRDYVKSIPHDEAMAWVEKFCQDVEAPSLRGDVLSWDDLRALAKMDVTLGAHTRTHPIMSQISITAAREEIAGSILDLKRETGESLPIFAYPSGGYTHDVLQILQEEGIKLAFTTERGHNHIGNTNKLLMKRINVGPGTSLSLLRIQLLERMAYLLR